MSHEHYVDHGPATWRSELVLGDLELFRHRRPPLVLIDEPYTPPGIHLTSSELQILSNLKADVFSRIGQEFGAQSCPVYQFDGNEQSLSGLPTRTSLLYGPDGHRLEPTQPVFLNPVFIGKLPDKLVQVLQAPTMDQFKLGMKQHWPEPTGIKLRPQASIISTKTGFKSLGWSENGELPRNFVNVFFIWDDGVMRGLDHQRTVRAGRNRIVKQGAPNIADIFFNSNGITAAMFHSLHGDHAEMDIHDLAVQLMINASTKDAQRPAQHDYWQFPAHVWESMAETAALHEYSRAMGRWGIVEPRIEVSDLIMNPISAAVIAKKIGKTGMSENAVMAIASLDKYASDPEIRKLMNEAGVQYVYIASATGSENVDKTNLNVGAKDPDVIPMAFIDGKLVVLSINGQRMKKVSVEAAPYAYAVRGREDKIAAISHNHVSASGKGVLPWVPLALPCGVEENKPVTQDFIDKTITAGVPVGIGNITDHGIEAVAARIPGIDNPLRPFVEAVDSGQITLDRTVHQF